MAKDFRASQLEVKQIILSGGIAGKSNLGGIVYSGSIASDRAGTTAGPTLSVMLTNVGSDVLFFVSGSQTSGNPSAIGTGETVRSQVTLFGGDVVVSGTLYAERQVIEVDSVADGDFFVTGNMYVEPDTDSSESVAFRTAAGSNLFEIDSARHKIIMGGGSSKSLAPHNNAALTIVSASGADPEAEGGSKGNPSGYHTFFLTRDNTLNKTVGVAFGRKTATPNVGAAILHRRNGAYSRGSLEFYAKESDTFQSDLTLGLELSETGMALFHSGGHFGVPSSPNSLDPKTFTDTSFYVSGSRGSRGIPNSSGSAVFGGDLAVSGALHVMGNESYQGSGAGAGIILDSTGGSRIVWDSEVDGNSPDAQIFESSGDLYLSASDNIRMEATDAILLKGHGGLALLTMDTISGQVGSYFNLSNNDIDFRVANMTHDRAFTVDAAERTVNIDRKTAESIPGPDINFFVSGSIGGKDKATRGVSLFGGDTIVSGTFLVDTGINDTFRVDSADDKVGINIPGGDSLAATLHVSSSGATLVRAEGSGKGNVAGFEAYAYSDQDGATVYRQAAVLLGTITGSTSATHALMRRDNGTATNSHIISSRTDATQNIVSFEPFNFHILYYDPKVSKYRPSYSFVTASGGPSVLILSGGAATSVDESAGNDVAFYVSGAIGDRGSAKRGTSVFGGDVFVSGAMGINTVNVTTDGKVGIGVTTPSYKLSVGGNAEFGEYLYHRGDADTFLRFQDDQITLNAGNRNMIDLVEASADKVLILSGGAVTSFNEAGAADVAFYVSGAIGDRGSLKSGTAVFGGDVVISGSLHGPSPLIIGSGLEVTGSVDLGTAFSGSLTHLTDGTSYIVAGDNITVTTGSKGQLTIAGSAASGFTRNSSASRVYLTENDDKLNIGGGNADPGGKVEITVSDTENIDGLIIDFNETGGKTALEIDSESTSGMALKSQGFKAGYFKQDISNGYGLYITRDLAEGGNEPLVNMLDNNANNTQATLQVRQDGTGPILRLRDGSAIAHEFKDGGEVVFNENGAATGDFRVESAGEDEAIFLDASANTLNINSGSTAFITRINSNNEEALKVNDSGVVLNDTGHANNDFRVASNTKSFALFVSSSDDQVLIHSGGAPASFDEAKAPDVSFYVSGSRGTRGRQHERTTSVFGGDLVVSGALAISGSITDVNNPGAKIQFAKGGTNSFAITCADNKQILTRDSTGTPDSITINSDNAQIAFLVRTNSKMAIASKPESASANTVYINTDTAGEAGVDTCLWVSGSKGAIKTAERGTSVFGGDVLVSGSFRASQLHFTTHKASPGDANARFLRFDSNGSDQSVSDNNKMIAPYPGKLIKVVARGTSAPGSTVIGLHTNVDNNQHVNGTATEEITVDMSSAHTSYTFNFTAAANYGPSDIVGIKVNPNSDPGSIVVTAVWELDTTA